MSLNGIDISKWQAGLNAGTIKADFVIMKATEGVGYVDPQCDIFYQQAKSAGKLLGVYHFARPDGNDPISEANFFVDNIKNYIGEAILILDWETNPKNNVNWAKQWLDQVQKRTTVKPLIYMSESVANSYDWSSVANADYGLWVAKYADYTPDYNYNMTYAGSVPNVKWWKGFAMWQWTSSGRLDGWNGNLDCDLFYGSSYAWSLYAKKADPVPITPPVTPEPITPVVPVVPEPPKPEPITPEPITPVVPPIDPVTPVKPATNIVVKLIEALWNVLKKLIGVK